MKNKETERVKFVVRLPAATHADVVRAADGTGLSLNQIIETALLHMMETYDHTGAIPMKKNKRTKANASDEERVKKLLE